MIMLPLTLLTTLIALLTTLGLRLLFSIHWSSAVIMYLLLWTAVNDARTVANYLESRHEQSQ